MTGSVAARPHGSGAVPAGWVLVAQLGDGRSLLDSASVAAMGNGMYAATSRIEFVPARATPYGLYDGMKMDLEVDCPRRRMRVTAGTLQAGGRDLGAIPVASARAAWVSDEGVPLVAVVCRVAGAAPR